MTQIKYSITLKSDAELGSGFGTALVDSLLPRDINDNVVITASHIKGLIRENLETCAQNFIPETAIKYLFGEEGTHNGAQFHINDATLNSEQQSAILNITRTKLNEFGVAENGALRTSEAIASAAQFSAVINIKNNLSTNHADLLKLGLLSLFSVGGSRNRGAGACVVTIKNEKRTPGEILTQLSEVSDWDTNQEKVEQRQIGLNENEKPVTLKLIYKAENPVCVPESPVIGNNVITTGFTLAASAVQGVILHRINDNNPKLATECYNSPIFRAWPLNPCSEDGAFSMRVSFTHKVSKFKDEKNHFLFRDNTLHTYEADKISAKSPLKSSDGVLISNDDSVKLWKSSDMPRIISAHGVINGDRNGSSQKRNLYTIESLAPMTFVGMVTMPETAAQELQKSLKENAFVQLGKSRSVRGGGQLTAEVINIKNLPFMNDADKNKTFIVQSPILVDLKDTQKPVSEIIAKLVKEAGFGEVDISSGSINTQFGWNKTMNNGFLQAVAVIAPGAVFRTKNRVENLVEKLNKGIGKGRERGFGAVLPHPGLAENLYPDLPNLKRIKSKTKYAQEGYQLHKVAKDNKLSSSQLSRVQDLLLQDANKAIEYLTRQQQERPDHIWDRWSHVIDEIKTGIKEDENHYKKVLKVCIDLRVADED